MYLLFEFVDFMRLIQINIVIIQNDIVIVDGIGTGDVAFVVRVLY